MTAWLANPTVGEQPYWSDLNGKLDQITSVIDGLGAGVPGSAGSEYIDPSQAPYNCDMTGATPNGTTHIGAGNGTAVDGHDATHGFMRAVWDAEQTGKTLWIPPGAINMLRDDGVTPALIRIDMSLKKRRVVIRGCGQGVTTLKWTRQLGTVTDPTDLVLGGDPSGRIANFAIDEWLSNNTNQSIHLSDLTLVGPGNYVGTTADGVLTENRRDGWGVRMGGRALIERVEITGFHSAAVYRMRGGPDSSHQDHNVDHNTIRDCNFHDNFYNRYSCYYWPVSGANSGDGDQICENTQLSQAAKACNAWDPKAAQFDSRSTSCHTGFSPYGNYSEFGPQSEVLLNGTQPGATAAATVARDAAGLVTIVTNIAAIAAPWGPFDIDASDSRFKPWNNGTIVAAGGFILGDRVDLSDIVAGTHGHGTADLLAGDAKCLGRVTGKTGNTLTILMENPKTTAAFSATTVSAGGIDSPDNQVRMLDTNVEFDGTYEGIGNSVIFAPNRSVLGYATTTALPSHSLMSVDNNKGNQNAYSPTPLYSLVRTNLTHPGQAHASSGDVMQIVGRCPAGTRMTIDDNWFVNATDDSPPSTNWSQDPDTCRGVQRMLAVTDGTDGGTTLTFTYQQLATNANDYTEKTLGNPATITGTAGSCGRVAGFVAQYWEIHEGPTFDCSSHPPDNTDIGGKLAAVELVAAQIHSCRMHMLQGVSLYPRLMGGTFPTDTEPTRSLCISGDREILLTHTTAAVAFGDIVEFAGKDDVRPYQGGTIAGVALWSRQSGDFVAVMRKGILRAEVGYDAQGVKSSVAFSQGDLIAADASNHGKAKASGSGAAIIGRGTVNSPAAVGGVYTTALRIEIRNPIP